MSDAKNQRNELLAQARVRLFICAFMGFYYLFFGITNHPVYLLFCIYSLALLFASAHLRTSPFIIPILTLIIDNGFAICGLHVTGESGTFLLFFLIHISFAYGLRYGRHYLLTSLLLACSGITWLYYDSAPWQGRIHFLLSFLFGMPFISFYVYLLTGRLRKSERHARLSHQRSAQLLAFLSHDVRAPLQHILDASIQLQEETLSVKGFSSVRSIQKMTGFLVQMANGVMNHQLSFQRNPDVSHQKSKKENYVSVDEWLLTLLEAFRGPVEVRCASLRCVFEGPLGMLDEYTLSHIERILVNIISNSIRFCEFGFIEIKVSRAKAPLGKLRFEVANERRPPFDNLTKECAAPPAFSKQTYGTGYGLKLASDVAVQIGGRLSFSPIDANHFCSVVEIPSSGDFEAPVRISTLPVIVVSSNIGLWHEIRQLNSGAANFFWTTPSRLNTNSPELLNSIFIMPDGKGIASDSFACLQSRSDSPRVLIRLGAELGNDTLLVKGTEIALHHQAPPETFRNALRLANFLVESTVDSSKLYPTGNNTSNVRRKILFVDDNIISMSIAATRLSRFGLDFSLVTTTRDALDAIRSKDFDLLIMDWNIGLDTADKILSAVARKSAETALPVLILSAEDILLLGKDFIPSVKIKKLLKPVTDKIVYAAICDLIQVDPEESRSVNCYLAHEILDCETYLEMEMNEDVLRSSMPLLTQFVASLEKELDSLRYEFGTSDIPALEAKLHSLASMCYTAGAHSLGDALKAARSTASGETSNKDGTLDYQFQRIQILFALTRNHVYWLLESFASILALKGTVAD